MDNLELIVAVFGEESQATEILDSIKELKKDQYIEVRHAAVVIKGADGEIQVQDIEDVSSDSGKKFGAMAGGLIGLLGGGPIGAAIGVAAGAATGKAAADKLRFGIPKEDLEAIQARLQPGSSAIITYAQIPFLQAALRQLRNSGAEVFHQPVDVAAIPVPTSQQFPA
jgi:uncharacterized membrane protein